MLLASVAMHATTIVLPTDEQLIAKSPVIVEGTVVSSTPVERNGSIWTDTVVSVARNVKGRTPETITVHELGGIVGERVTRIYGTPVFTAGKQVLLFLEPSPRGGYRTIDLFVGKFERAQTLSGQRLWLREDYTNDATLLDADFQPLAARNVQRDAAGFDAFVAERLAGRAGRKNYGIENPSIAPEKKTAARGVTSNFTLIDEPNLYRWFRFDTGDSAAWYSGGAQPGYSGGGVSELQTGMAPWNDYSSAKIFYTYAGTRTGSFGGMDKPNGVNEVLFNDPLNDISGSYNPSTGGTVGIGGFNGVQSQRNWTAPFTADPTHTAGAYKYWNIVEGNLVIQDGVTPSNGISSNELAEIIAHELGHTLGFGHSADNKALMYSFVTGLGPALRTDDQLAARWLYPNGVVDPGPEVPAAPSGLEGSASGSSINLSWTDNASNEQGFYVYVNNQAAATLGANASSATLSGYGAGTYSIHVVAFNATGSSAASNSVSVTVLPLPPVASFTVSPESQTAGKALIFTSTSTGTISSIQWDFGDGTNSTSSTVPHVYNTPGDYTVSLVARNGTQFSTATKVVTINGALTPSFTFTPAAPTTNDIVEFDDASTGGATSWFWSFGDGTTSSEQNPSKHYALPGSYPVALTIFRNSDSATTAKTIDVTQATVPVTPTVVAAFDMSAQTVATGTNVSFTDQSLGNPTQWSWSFGDGATANSRNPVHAYAAPGTYMVTLTASNASTSGMTSKQIVVVNTIAFRTMVSAAAQAPGLGGTSWRTELNVFNAGSQAADVSFVFVPSAGGSAVVRTLFLAPKQSKTYANALLDLFDLSSGVGGLTIEATSAGTSANLRITSRTFTTGATGTYGQAVPDVRPGELERTLYVTGIIANADYRTNIGLVNGDASTVNATLTLLNEIGTPLGTRTILLPARSFQQTALLGLFPVLEGGSYDALTLRIVSTSDGVVSGYASVIDNRTQDPIYIQAVPPKAGTSMVVPVVGRAPGANGTFWRSDVTFFNPATSTQPLTLRYNGAARTVLVEGNDTLVLDDVLAEFGHNSGSGLLSVSWTNGSTGPIVTSRTYTSVDGGGTYGQSIDPVAAFGSSMYVPGLRHDGSYRSNVGLVNGGNETEVVTVRLLSPFGTELGRSTVTLAPNAQIQYGVAGLFPDAGFGTGFTLSVEGDANAKVFAYGSMIDNKSGDPVFFAGR
ncbi:MAG TPA: PKD domain-containing protein [Thermoanaerobaculia bacterium]|jgi:PKD repeat protein